VLATGDWKIDAGAPRSAPPIKVDFSAHSRLECAIRRPKRCQPPTRACLTQTGAGGSRHLWVSLGAPRVSLGNSRKWGRFFKNVFARSASRRGLAPHANPGAQTPNAAAQMQNPKHNNAMFFLPPRTIGQHCAQKPFLKKGDHWSLGRVMTPTPPTPPRTMLARSAVRPPATPAPHL
jgi:hypothetical protein